MATVVRGNYSGRVTAIGAIASRALDASTYISTSAISNRIMDASITSSIYVRDRGSAEGGVAGYLRGLSFLSPTTIDGQGSFGRHMQYGISKENIIGSPSAPSLKMDYPGFWRFRWVVRPGTRKVSISVQQNSTGSYRPSIIVKANPTIGVATDISASAADIAGWTTIGPVQFASMGTDVVWVELHNNNYGMPTLNGSLVNSPAYFDHIVVS